MSSLDFLDVPSVEDHVKRDSYKLIRAVANEVTDKINIYISQRKSEHNSIPDSTKVIYFDLMEFSRGLFCKYRIELDYEANDPKTKDCVILENALSDLYSFSRRIDKDIKENPVIIDM